MLQAVLDTLLPPLCMACKKPVANIHSVCAPCWEKINFISKPFCACCGLPFPFDIGEEALCGHCIQDEPHYAKARAAARYDDHSRPLVLAYKHGDKTHLQQLMTKWMFLAGRQMLEGSDVIVPVPLHWTRLLRRKYNQAALLAHGLGNIASRPVWDNALLRHKKTKPHERMSKIERAENVKGAFRLNPKYRSLVQDKNIVLIDDVMTSGATLNECARVLNMAGAQRVEVLTLARVCLD